MATVLAALGESAQLVAQGQRALDAGDDFGAARAFQQAIYRNRNQRSAYTGLARAFLAGGFTDNAIQHFVRAAKLGALSAEDESQWAKAVALRERRGWDLRRARSVLGLPVVRFLGAGWEGANYVAREPSGARVVVKMFHPAFVRLINYEGVGGVYREPVPSAGRDLKRLAAGANERGHALYRFQPLEVDGEVVAVKYDYEYLLPISWRSLRTQSMRLAVLAGFLRTQAYLIRTFALCLSDAWVSRQFMLSVRGHPRYVDYGTTIIPLDDFRCREDRWELFAVIEILLSVFKPEREAMLSGAPLSQAIECVLTLGPGARRFRLVREMLQHLESGRWEMFLDADFYRHLGKDLPVTAGFLPRIAVGASALRHRAHH